MRPARQMLVSALALLFASACSQEAETPVNQQAADANATMTDPANPYAEVETQMRERMAAAQGSDPSETWVRKMIEHHRGAIAMTNVLERLGGDPQVLEKARMAADKQRREISELEGLLPAGSAQATASGAANPYAQAVSQMQQHMMAASGDNPSETWLRKMIAHHRGGVAMSDVLFDLNGDPEVVAKARMTAQDQAKEAEELERMLQGGDAATTAAAESATVAAPREPAKAAPRSTPKADVGATQPESTAAPEEPADPHAGHDMDNMSNMSH